MRTKDIVAIIFTSGVVVFFLILVIGGGVQRNATHECKKWADYADSFPNFYLSEWQKKQCDHVGVEVNAPVGRAPIGDPSRHE